MRRFIWGDTSCPKTSKVPWSKGEAFPAAQRWGEPFPPYSLPSIPIHHPWPLVSPCSSSVVYGSRRAARPAGISPAGSEPSAAPGPLQRPKGQRSRCPQPCPALPRQGRDSAQTNPKAFPRGCKPRAALGLKQQRQHKS